MSRRTKGMGDTPPNVSIRPGEAKRGQCKVNRLARVPLRGMTAVTEANGGVMRSFGILLAAAAFVAPVTAGAAPAQVAAAVTAPGRTPDNVKLDEGRKPAEVLSFFGLRRGMKVIDMFGANQYWAEIMAPVVGPRGRVTVWQPSQFLNDDRRTKFAEFAKRRKNVSLISSPFEAPNLPANAYDFMIMNLDYHDVYWENPERKIVRMEPDPWVKTLYAAMKPGAIVGVIDHVALPNSDVRAT